MADAKKKTELPATKGAALIEPPAQQRTRESSADPAIIMSMLTMIEQGWATDGREYKLHKDAGNASVVHRRALIRELGGKPDAKGDPIAKTIRSKVWGKGDKGTAPFVFALTRKKKED